MSLISFLYLFITGALLAILLYLIALAPRLDDAPPQSVLAYNEVRGMAVESEGVLYTLNFEQQNRVVAALNRKEKIPNLETCAPSMDKLIIYRFDAPEWVLNLAKEESKI
jgi:hypothetical protein